MTYADRLGVAAGTLHQTVRKLRGALAQFRGDAARSEQQFDDFEQRWKIRDEEISRQLREIGDRLNQPGRKPRLTIVRADD